MEGSRSGVLKVCCGIGVLPLRIIDRSLDGRDNKNTVIYSPSSLKILPLANAHTSITRTTTTISFGILVH